MEGLGPMRANAGSTLNPSVSPNVAGVFMGYTGGGAGVDEGSAGAGGTVTMTNQYDISLEGSTHSGYFQSLISATSIGGNGDGYNDNYKSSGGNGGSGQKITLANSGNLTISGTVQPYHDHDNVRTVFPMFGIRAVSGGGTGGDQNNGVVGDQLGGSGGWGGAIDLTNSGAIRLGSTSTRLSGKPQGAAIHAESYGGSGGTDYGSAGSGSWVSVGNTGDLDVVWDAKYDGDGVYGIHAISSGGAGTQANNDNDNSDPGGTGGAGGTVTVTSGGQTLVDVSGVFSGQGAGIAALSQGGKGGTGPAKDKTGGTGGTGGYVSVALRDGSITTRGENLYGILAQSIGGQGGDGGDGAALAGQGGGAGFGGNASGAQVILDGSSTIETHGNYAAGIMAQSIGGGGGTGGTFVSVLAGEAGNGGSGGNANLAKVDAAGSITTSGDHAYGIVAQSIAGSGGAGGLDVGVIALGGDGAGGGAAGQVEVSQSGTIKTAGYSAHGVLAQSIGGGGGASGSAIGGFSVGGSATGTEGSNGSTVIVRNSGSIHTTGNAAVGVLAQSIGGGGGSGGDSKGIAGIGGEGASGGEGGRVLLQDLGSITTDGRFSPAVLAQSVGGGGGNGGDTQTASAGVSVAIGGSGSGGGNGGSLCLGNAGFCGETSAQGIALTTAGDYSPGIIAQNIGGGGGNGGSVDNVSLASFAALQLGGQGAKGGNAGGDGTQINYENLGIRTSGAHSTGILAQSIGGGGGTGGDSNYFNATIGLNAAVVVGGNGGAGGAGAKTQVILKRSQIATGMGFAAAGDNYAPDDSYGVLAQSIGGGGGNGGSSSASDLVVAVPLGAEVPPISFSFQASVGGSGGGGGSACGSGSSCVTEVGLYEGTSITTLGDGSHAVVAQSIGGGGGNGGDASALSTGISYGDSISGKVGMALGGSGGTASSGGKVVVNLGTDGYYASLPASIDLPIDLSNEANVLAPDSTILTYGDFANGVLAQSVGGGGGNGGVGSSNSYSAGGMVELDLNIGLGGTGGGGGNGGDVDVALASSNIIHTVGSGSRGILAQSIGGGGGTSQGGTMSMGASVEGFGGKLTLGVGQTGGSGGKGGHITADINGAIRTQGGDADAVALQSIGGGGGLAGSIGADSSSNPILDRIGKAKDTVGRVTDDGSRGYGFEVDIGGKGGSGGAGGQIDLNFAGKIATAGDWADGIVAQSIGGGGGAGGSSTAAGSSKSAQINIAVGGSGGAAGNGGPINAYFDGSHDNSLDTLGYGAYGVLLQSIGGGGGQGGDGSDMAHGDIFVGGSDGGNGGTSGVGGDIRTTGTGSWLSVGTKGADAPAFAAQSIGGGGGVGGAGNSDSQSKPNSESSQVAVSVGGHGGSGNNGGTVALQLGTNASTKGDRSYGFLAQSIGGGGGVGGAGKASNLTSVGLGGRGGAGGDGGNVSLVFNSGSVINTSGAGAHGIVAQSIGGGGGIAGDSSLELGLKPDGWVVTGDEAGGRGKGGTVKIDWTGSLQASGANAFGIVAQSIGGGGGIGGGGNGVYAGSTGHQSGSGQGGAVNVTQHGVIQATGGGSTGVFAQSTGPDGGQAVQVDVYGSVQGGSGNGASVWIADGRDNKLDIHQDGVVKLSASGTGVRYTGKGTNEQGYVLDINLDGNGTFEGNMECGNASGSGGGGADAPCHAASGEEAVMKEATLYQADIDNGGLLEIGRTGKFDTLTVTGDYQQRSTGVLRADTDFGGMRSDLLEVQGDARLDGRFDVASISLLPRRELKVLDVKGATTGSLQVIDSPIFNFQLRPEGRSQFLSVKGADFNAASQNLEGNQRGVARHLQQIWDQGGTVALGPLFAVLNTASRRGAGTYRERLTDLSPGASLAPASQMAAGMANFMGAMMSCPVMEGDGTLGRERNCLWGQITRRNTDNDGGNGSPGYSFDSTTSQFGGQYEFKPDWFLGGSFAYQDNRLEGNSGRVSGRGDAGYVGIVLKHQAGPWTYSGSLGGGYGSTRMDRSMSIEGYDPSVHSDPDAYSVGARLRVARHIELSRKLYLKPYVDIDALYTRMPGYSESGGPLSLKVDSNDQFLMSLSPMLEFGGRVDFSNGAVMRPYVYAGASFLSKDSWDASARLSGAPAGSGEINTSLPGDNVVGRFGLGVLVNTESGVDVRLQYDGEVSGKTHSHAGQLKVMYRF
ncbi:autotransporter outer membrane beta-barrel domain-containing protein [Candidimonas nitroreducens]|nr:autotransporter outer membrane beta-barrel domain-containing protein [Candidimonas nitroreducens]